MIELTTGVDWIEKLFKLLLKFKAEEKAELQKISKLLNGKNAKELAKIYVEPDCQSVHVGEYGSPAAPHQPVVRFVDSFLDEGCGVANNHNALVVLADAGMGKTSLLAMLKLTNLAGLWIKEQNCVLLKIGTKTLVEVEKIKNDPTQIVGDTTLLLDSLDEDPVFWSKLKTTEGNKSQAKDYSAFEERLSELLAATKQFRRVIITCRTQYFPAEEERKDYYPSTGVFKLSNKLQCTLTYLRPFSMDQVNHFIEKKFRGRSVFGKIKSILGISDSREKRAKEVSRLMKSLRTRPMLLAHIDYFVDSKVSDLGWDEYSIYEYLVEQWLVRQFKNTEKRPYLESEEETLAICTELAYHFLSVKGTRSLSRNQITKLLKVKALHLRNIEEASKNFVEALTQQVEGGSLLTKNVSGKVTFAHRTIAEFLVAKDYLNPKTKARRVGQETDQIATFFKNAITGIDITKTKVYSIEKMLRSVTFPSIVLEKLDLKEAQIQKLLTENEVLDFKLIGIQSFAVKKDIEAQITKITNDKGCRFVDALYCTDFSHSDLADLNLRGSCLVAANLEGANLEGVILEGANLLGAILEGAFYNDQTVWPKGFDFKNSRAIGPGANLLKANFEEANLQEANLEGASLREANLGRAKLQGASLQFANLQRANLEGAKLEGAKLEGAKLEGANLRRAYYDDHTVWPDGFKFKITGALGPRAILVGANLEGANLQGAKLQGAYLRGASLQFANLQRANLEGAKLEGAKLEGAKLEGANLRRAYYDDHTVWPDGFKFKITGALGPRAILVGANLEGANLQGAKLQGAYLREADLQGAILREANLQGAYLLEANLQEANLQEANLQGANLGRASLQGASLQGASLQRAKLRGAKIEGASLQFANLQGAKLEEAGLQGASLEGANLKEANLEGASLRFANLQGANLREAKLEGADLEGANLEGANLREFDLREARLEGANLEGAKLKGTNLQGAKLRGTKLKRAYYDDHTVWPDGFKFKITGALGPRAILVGANFEGAKLEEANLEEANLGRASLVGASLEGASLRFADLEGANLEGANLREADLEGANLEGANLEGANLRESDLREARLEGANLEGANLQEANLQGAHLWEAYLVGANLRRANVKGAYYNDQTVWPDGYDFKNTGAIPI